MTGSFSPSLVALSVAIAVLATYALVALAARLTASRGRFFLAWLAGGSVAAGVGIWSMHFVGMLALRLPVPAAYRMSSVLLSALIGISSAAVLLLVASRPRVDALRLGLAGVLGGAALAAMHLVGMAGLQVAARVLHQPGRLVASLGLALVTALGTAAVAVRLRADERPSGRRARLAGSVVLGLLLAGMHYTAMSAARFGPPASALPMMDHAVLRTAGLALGVAASAFALLGAVLIIALAERRVRIRNAETEAVQRSEERFRALVEASAQIVWHRDAQGRFAAPQQSWESFTGMRFEEYRGTGWIAAVHPEDRAGVARGWEQAVTRPAPHTAEFRLRNAAGDWRHMAVRAVPVLGPDGGIREWVGTATDVTEQREEAQGQLFLAEAGRVLGASLDPEATLRSVARLAVPALADWCAVDLLDEFGTLRRVAVEHLDPAKIALAQELQERYPPSPEAEHGVPAVLRTGITDWMGEIPYEALERTAADEEHLRLLHALGLRSYIIAPMAARGRVLGALTLVHAESGRRFSERDLPLVEETARRAAVAVDNARLFREAEESREQLEQQAGELQEAQAEMEMAHDELQRANEDLLKRTEEAERARQEAEDANDAKSEFLATMSHELRTPLNAISGYAELMAMGVHGPLTDAQRDALERIRRNQLHLLGLINDVLNFARLEAGQVSYELRAVPLDDALRALESLVAPQLSAGGLTYEYRAGDAEVAAWADRERMEQVILNLLTNAIKFTPRGGRVTLSWEATEEVVRIAVSDTGIGIAADKLGLIFEPFTQVDPSLTRSSEGTGLGLSISRDLARAMGGDIEVQSEVGKGSVFTLTLPRARAEGRDAA